MLSETMIKGLNQMLEEKDFKLVVCESWDKGLYDIFMLEPYECVCCCYSDWEIMKFVANLISPESEENNV